MFRFCTNHYCCSYRGMYCGSGQVESTIWCTPLLGSVPAADSVEFVGFQPDAAPNQRYETIVDSKLNLLRKVYEQWRTVPSLNSIAVGTAEALMYWDLILPRQSGSCRSPSGLLQDFFVSVRPTIPVPWWLVCHLPRVIDNVANLPLFGRSTAKKLSVSGLTPYPGALPGTPLGQSLPTSIVGSSSLLAIFSTKQPAPPPSKRQIFRESHAPETWPSFSEW